MLAANSQRPLSEAGRAILQHHQPKVVTEPPPLRDAQRHVDAYFRSKASFWDELYESSTAYAAIHQDRLAAVLGLVNQLAPPPGSRVLEVGCGAGSLAVAVAQRGYRVNAVDSVEAMIRLTRQRADAARVAERVITSLSDAQSLAFPDNQFSLVLAIGVIPWLPSARDGVKELARLVRPGGHLIANADNVWRLNHVLDPLKSPVLPSIRGSLKKILGISLRPDQPVGDDEMVTAHLHTTEEIDSLFANCGLEKVQTRMLGFGPFTFFGHKALPDWLGVKVHRLLQRGADLRFPVLRFTGAQYLVLARKPAPGESFRRPLVKGR